MNLADDFVQRTFLDTPGKVVLIMPLIKLHKRIVGQGAVHAGYRKVHAILFMGDALYKINFGTDISGLIVDVRPKIGQADAFAVAAEDRRPQFRL